MPSPQPAARTGGQYATNGGISSPAPHRSREASAPANTTPVIANTPAPAPAPAVTVAHLEAGRTTRHRDTPPPSSGQPHEQHASHSIADLAATFIAKLQPPFAPRDPLSAPARKSGQLLGLAAIALFLFVITELLLVRTSAQPIQLKRSTRHSRPRNSRERIFGR